MENKTVVQIGVIVRDAASAAHMYADLFEMPVPQVVIIADDPDANTRYRGQPSNAIGKAAFFDMGSVQLELIEPIGGPSSWQDFLEEHGQGIHHIAIKVQDLQQTGKLLNSKAIPMIQSGAWPGGEYAYFDGTEKLGLFLEILQIDQ
ncbi:MAG: VOC family protein [Anaerolineales bacterium]|nr:VOC family protein [Anaerolineales bacterium]